MSVMSETLDEAIRGPVITPEDRQYDDARTVYNAMHDRHPRAVVRPVDAADVMAALAHATDRGLPVAVRGGSHSVPGYGTVDDGVVIDLRRMRGVRIDPDRRTARVGGGALLGDVDHAGYPFGLATPLGFASTTGIGGLTLGGGIAAYLGRKYGLTCDNLLSADVVTADGRQVTASRDRNSDLFWALRGGGGNFGVVTSFEFRLHPVKDVVGGPIFFEIDAARDVLSFYRDYLEAAPRELGGFVGFHRAPPLPFIPEARHDEPHVVVVTCWSGDPEEAGDVIAPIRAAGPVAAEHVGPMPYPVLQSAFDELVPAGLRHYWKPDFVAELTDDAIAAHAAHGRRVPSVNSTMHLYPTDGAVQDVAPEATAYAHRSADFAMTIVGMWREPSQAEEHMAWVTEYYEAVHPHSGHEGGYTNFAAADDQARVRENYGSSYDRLARIKAEWDPDNVFRLNQNIEPA
ncbi:MAG: FAD-binding oxidoreductase [Candidatus Longimicrobiales bacterium M2_2A_002]